MRQYSFSLVFALSAAFCLAHLAVADEQTLPGVAYALMIRRANFLRSDASEVRQAFQEAAARAMAKP